MSKKKNEETLPFDLNAILEETNDEIQETPEEAFAREIKEAEEQVAKEFKDEIKAEEKTNAPTHVEKEKIIVDPNEIVEEVFSSVYREFYGGVYSFSLNYKNYVVFFDGKTPTKLPKVVMEWFKKKLLKMDNARDPYAGRSKIDTFDV